MKPPPTFVAWYRCQCGFRSPVSGPWDKVDSDKYRPHICGKCGVTGQFTKEKAA
jgi:hypothetical protein